MQRVDFKLANKKCFLKDPTLWWEKWGGESPGLLSNVLSSSSSCFFLLNISLLQKSVFTSKNISHSICCVRELSLWKPAFPPQMGFLLFRLIPTTTTNAAVHFQVSEVFTAEQFCKQRFPTIRLVLLDWVNCVCRRLSSSPSTQMGDSECCGASAA